MKVLNVIRERHYPFYDIRDEMWDNEFTDQEPSLMKKLAYSKQGDWIGSSKEAYRMVHRFGIQQFEKTEDDHCICSIGYAPKDNKWYGWSHRAIFGFTKGSSCKKGDCHYIPKTFAEIQIGCHCKKREGRLAMCHANASVALIPENPDEPLGSLIPDGSPVEGIKKCTAKNCVFEIGRGEWIAETMDDAKQMAIDFAKSVS